jgi:hypothetical protein
MKKFRVLCAKENIWFSIHETTDAGKRKTANVIGVLKNDQTLSEKTFLVS